MTVQELIALLQQHPSDLRVVVSGYEDGYDDLSPKQLVALPLYLDTKTRSYYGQHEDARWPTAAEKRAGRPTSPALALCRTSY